jgi:hypothetical protein
VSAEAFRKLSEWLRIDEAATELSRAMSEPVSAAEVLRLAIDEHLKLSLYLPASVKAQCQRILDDGFDPEIRLKSIKGLCDLPMIGRAKLQIEHNYQYMLGNYVPMDGPVGASVEHDNLFCKLSADPGATGMSTRPASEFPRGSVLCVRRVVLEEFIAQHASAAPAKEQEAVLDKPLRERERSTLLTIIAALAKAADIDISKPSKAAEAIEALTTQLGARVSARSVEDHLKRIPDAIERKGKTST